MTGFLTRLLLFSVLIQIPGDAQESPGLAITGIVLDPHQAGVLDAKITLKRVDRGQIRTTIADASGKLSRRKSPLLEPDEVLILTEAFLQKTHLRPNWVTQPGCISNLLQVAQADVADLR